MKKTNKVYFKGNLHMNVAEFSKKKTLKLLYLKHEIAESW